MFISKGDSCCGCMACVAVCPQKVLNIEKDKLGFSYPFVELRQNCIECNLCNQVCPLINIYKETLNADDVLCAYNANDNYRFNSSSGGVFRAICDYVFDNGGVCYGAAFTDDFQVKHIKITNREEFYLISGSKYVESDVCCYHEVKRDLLLNRLVMFSGTPCQLHGLSNYLGKAYKNLIKVDLFCYGIPSPNVWRRWLEYISQGRKVSSVNFRDKTYGWDDYSLVVDFSDGSSYLGRRKSDYYISTFSKGGYIRKSCYTCDLKAFPRNSDITLGDFQELKKIFPNENPRNGWSMVKLNTADGRIVLDAIRDRLVIKTVTADVMNRVHPNIAAPSKSHKNRDKLERQFDNLRIQSLLKRYARPAINTRIKMMIKGVLIKLGG